MSEPMVEPASPTRKLIAAALTWDYGTCKTHEEIANVVGLPGCSDLYRMVVSKANKYLTKLGRRLGNVRGVGYKVLTPEEYNPHATEIVHQGRKKIRLAKKVLVHAPVKDMTVYDQMKRTELIDSVNRLDLVVGTSVKGMEKILARRPKITLSK